MEKRLEVSRRLPHGERALRGPHVEAEKPEIHWAPVRWRPDNIFQVKQ